MFWKLNLMECVEIIIDLPFGSPINNIISLECVERAKLVNKSVSNRNQRVCVVGWVDVWE